MPQTSKKAVAKKITDKFTRDVEKNKRIANQIGAQLEAAKKLVEELRPVMLIIDGGYAVGKVPADKLRAALNQWDTAAQIK